MGLSKKYAQAHIALWEKKLSGGYYAYRKRWPAHLFRHDPIENAAEILKRGSLLSRHDSAGLRQLDVADPDIVANRIRAHKFARLYFRPRTPTQYHIEGIKKPEEYYHGHTHAPTLVVFVLDALSILTAEGVRFSGTNMQSPYSVDGDDEEFFDTIDFSRVYHEGSFGGDQSITAIRCAEVLAPSPLPIKEHLRAILCRSQGERMTLLDKLGKDAKKWAEKIEISDDLRVFEKRYTYVERVSIDEDGLLLALAPRSDGSEVNVRIVVKNKDGLPLIDYGPKLLKPFPPDAKKLWRFKGNLDPGLYQVQVWLEGCAAFEAKLLQENMPF